MKSVVLVCKVRGREAFKCFAAGTSAPVEEFARGVRESGLFDGEPVEGGVVLHTERPMPVMRFKCAAVPSTVSEGPDKPKRRRLKDD